MKKFTKNQPKKGQIICTCGHKSELGSCHYWNFSGGIKINSEKSLKLLSVSYWVELCPKCHSKAYSEKESNVASLVTSLIKSHYLCNKDEPFIVEE